MELEMRVVDLLLERSLQLLLQTPSSELRLATELSGCAPTELMDPTPFLDPHSLLLTSGIGMNFSDERTWDAFVERLAEVPVSAIVFATGMAHRALPPGLIGACTKHDVPLLEVPAAVPPLQVNRFIESLMQAERLAVVNRGWTLADECARLANQDAEVVTLLATVFNVIQSPLAVYDAYGTVIAQYPALATWTTGIRTKPQVGVLSIPLPMGLNNPCRLAIREKDSESQLASLLGPVASIIALQLNRSVIVDASRQHEIKNFVIACESWEEATHLDVRRAFVDIGLDARVATSVLVADMSGELASTSWQLRVALHEKFQTLRVTEFGDRLVAFAQNPRMDFDEAVERLLHIHDRQPLVVKGPTLSLFELRLSVVHALQLVQGIDRPQLAPELGLSAVVTATAGRGAKEAARKFLAPLWEHDLKRAGPLVETLRAYLDNDAQPSKTCSALFIHRNSLNYRLRKIETLLRLNLGSVEGQATCLIALRLVDLGEK
ncbi:PucR family transcriptional regulator [Cryobacterium sp. TMT1-66-1]|uniref:helix-turn-helix domain-containing protein n=2 Tax=unclassified Cryobacterium TaxID=2649013 RepID=UPI00106BCEF8|nr:PucR family transcriptional regulator [Cryobacterium sp. TMT1-66-1]TFD02750.1 PucR family transcriptional regulator [Cryobacterium sp. TMT1-66-1]TFD11445.1 PucR family transcriptional regulator [Cryobacterium sp. TMT1-2-2]